MTCIPQFTANKELTWTDAANALKDIPYEEEISHISVIIIFLKELLLFIIHKNRSKTKFKLI